MTRTDDGGLAVRADAFGDAPTAALLVRQVRWEADGIVSVELTPRGGGALPGWEPGAHVDVFLESGLVRQYSLCGGATDRSRYRIAVLREPDGRGGSEEIHRDIRAGATITIGKPRNLFRVPDAPGYLCIAGGVGVTPIVSIAEDALARELPVRVVYGGRSRDSMSFVEELAALLPPSMIDVVPQDRRGMIDLEREVAALPDSWVICACGPSAMLEALEAVCERRGVRDRLVVERFTAPDNLETEFAGAENKPVTVHLERSGTTLEVPADQTILDAVKDIASVISSCTEGYCGTCETRVLRGTPEHRDTVLTDEERASNEIMMICVSRARTDGLTLDL
ncbi:PDR/VanB family oxidoreductase [Pseudonocardia sp. GCM10023141]|uniref:PDR/VanB family oxidoreductase n=1 Tax=Pseudonocardia sp. GCM10023141 TaxID=3252653 RepID=UPI00361F104F